MYVSVSECVFGYNLYHVFTFAYFTTSIFYSLKLSSTSNLFMYVMRCLCVLHALHRICILTVVCHTNYPHFKGTNRLALDYEKFNAVAAKEQQFQLHKQ